MINESNRNEPEIYSTFQNNIKIKQSLKCKNIITLP